MLIKLSAYICPHQGESYLNCGDRYNFNQEKHAFALSDGVGGCLEPTFLSRRLVKDYVDNPSDFFKQGKAPDYSEAYQEYDANVQKHLSEDEKQIRNFKAKYLRRTSPSMSNATFIGFSLSKSGDDWYCNYYSLGDSYMFVINKDTKEYVAISSMKDGEVAPHQFHTDGTASGQLITKSMPLQNDSIIVLMSDALSHWFVDNYENEALFKILALKNHHDYLKFIEDERKSNLQDDDSSMMILELCNVQEPNIKYQINNYDDIDAFEAEDKERERKRKEEERKMVEEEKRKKAEEEKRKEEERIKAEYEKRKEEERIKAEYEKRKEEERKMVEEEKRKKAEEEKRKEEERIKAEYEKRKEEERRFADEIKTIGNDLKRGFEEIKQNNAESVHSINANVEGRSDYISSSINDNFKAINDNSRNIQDIVTKQLNNQNENITDIKKKLNNAVMYIIIIGIVQIALLLFIGIMLISNPVSPPKEVDIDSTKTKNELKMPNNDSSEMSLDTNTVKTISNDTSSTKTIDKNDNPTINEHEDGK